MAEDPVEKALDEVIEKIREGAQPLEVKPEVAAEMRARYAVDFKKPENQRDWPRDRTWILWLSKIVGHLAEFLTRVWAALHGESEPKEVDRHSAYLAGFLVSRTICPVPTSGPKPRGRHCESYPSPGALADLVAGLLRQAVKHAMPRITSGPFV